MKLTKRETILLSVLGALVAAAGLYYFVISPTLGKISELRQKADATRVTYQNVKLYLSPDNKINKDYKVMNQKVLSITGSFFPTIIQEKITLILDDMLRQSGLKASVISFSEPGMFPVDSIKGTPKDDSSELEQLLNEYYNSAGNKSAKPQAANQVQGTGQGQASGGAPQQDTMNTVEKLTATISYKGEYGSLMKLLQIVEGYDKKIVVKSLGINKNSDSSLAGNIILDFYAIPKLFDTEDDYSKWTISGNYGVSNPFEPFTGYNYTASTPPAVNTIAPLPVNYDFALSVQPMTADFPSVIMGRTDDSTGKSNIYADNSGIESMELEVSQSNGKYYCRYKTQGESYPEGYKSPGAEFTPRGASIELKIISSARNSASDVNGVSLKIVNNTSLPLNVKIENDDPAKPRVAINDITGNVTVR